MSFFNQFVLQSIYDAGETRWAKAGKLLSSSQRRVAYKKQKIVAYDRCQITPAGNTLENVGQAVQLNTANPVGHTESIFIFREQRKHELKRSEFCKRSAKFV